MSKALQLLSVESDFPDKPDGFKNLTALLLSLSPEFNAFEQTVVHSLTVTRIPDTANGERVWHGVAVLKHAA